MGKRRMGKDEIKCYVCLMLKDYGFNGNEFEVEKENGRYILKINRKVPLCVIGMIEKGLKEEKVNFGIMLE